MLRKDVVYMMRSNWEPKIPSEQSIVKQIEKSKGKVGGSVRLSTGHVSVGLKKNVCGEAEK